MIVPVGAPSMICKIIPATCLYSCRRTLSTIVQCPQKKSNTIMSNASEENFKVVKEGKAEVLFSSEVFYNPVQEFNRDLSIAVITKFIEEVLPAQRAPVSSSEDKETPESENGQNVVEVAKTEKQNEQDANSGVHGGAKVRKGIKVLEALAASGLRSIRYAKEIPGVEEIVANDIALEAVEAMKRNIAHNHLEGIVNVSQADACLLMYQNPKQYDVIDLDPYGCAAQFVDPAVHAVRPGGLLCVTCTDMTVLCGNYGEACFAKYGGYSVKATYSHEMALRILLHTLQASATRCGRYIEPLLSVSADFYIRVFVRVFNSQAEAKHTARKTAAVYVCTYCENFALQRFGQTVTKTNGNEKFTAADGPPVGQKCDNCGGRYHVAGPMWAEPLHNRLFVEKLLQHVKGHSDRFNTSARLEGLLTVVSEVRSAILNAGYQVSGTHCSAEGVKTNAPPSVIWDILRAWEIENPTRKERLAPQAVRILEKKSSIDVSFELHPDANPPSRNQKLRRFQQNPEKYWGPKKKAGPIAPAESLEERKHRRQGKRSRTEGGKPEMTGEAQNEKIPKTEREGS